MRLQGVLRRAVPISRLEARTRKRLSASARALGRRLDSRIESSGVLARLDRDAAEWRKRRGLKGPIGRGGTPLGPDHRRELQRIFETEGLEFFAQLIEGEMGAWGLEVEAILKDQYLEAYNAGGAGAQKKLGIKPNFKLRNPGILEALAERANMLSGGFSDDMFDRVRTVVAEEFFILGEHPFQVADALQDEFAFLSKSRAQTIARTETLTIVEQAQHQTYQASGVQLKRWLATLDPLTRFSHYKAHGQIKGIDEPFELTDEEGVTEELQFPGDPSGEPGNLVNCRCDFIGIVSEGQLLEPGKVWDGTNDPDEFSRERLAEEEA